MQRAMSLLFCWMALLTCEFAPALAAQTVFTLPTDILWIPLRGKGVPPGAFEVYLRGKASDRCGQVIVDKFPDGFVYPWHVNGVAGIYTILKGTLVIGFNRHRLASAEKSLPAGSVVQGLAMEPHYGRAVGETIFDIYLICPP